jgi:hypothetical protein
MQPNLTYNLLENLFNWMQILKICALPAQAKLSFCSALVPPYWKDMRPVATFLLWKNKLRPELVVKFAAKI